MNKKTAVPAAEPNQIILPERETIMEFLQAAGKPRKRRHIARQFNITDPDAEHALGRRLKAMARDGQLVRNRRGSYGLIDKMDLICGRVIAHRDGYGFLVPDGGGKDLFLSTREMRSLLHGDRAVVRQIKLDNKGRREGALVEVLKRANQRVIGRFHKEKNVSFVAPDNPRLHQDVLISEKVTIEARHGQFVLVEITQQPDRHIQPIGKVVEIIGDTMDINMATDIAIRSYDLPCNWSDKVKHAIGKLNARIDPDELKRRQDLRSLAFVTIDGEDARDFDDAVFCQRRRGGWRLLVAIADVAHYVKPDTGLDKEARKRGTSVYFPRRVIPMLPEVLSNDLCSLKPGVDRLSVVCELNIDKQGKVGKYKFIKAVIRSAARLSYNEMAAVVIDREQAVRKKHHSIVADLDKLYDLYRILHAYRKQQALIEFSTVETKFEFNKRGKIKNIHPLIRNDAHRIIEEFMLTANIAAGSYLQTNRIPALYRVHDSPAPEKLEEVKNFLKQAGLSLGKNSTPRAADYAALLERAQAREDTHLIEMILLRSMPLAVYSADNIGHFGLGFDVYAHFTSPIRRYPDLLTHRAIEHLLANKRDGFMYEQKQMAALGEHCSSVERRAEEATRDVAQRMKCIYMKQHVGDTFAGVITSVTSFGLFVELDDIYVEGLIHISTLPLDYYHYDAVGHSLHGERKGRKFKLTNRIRVTVSRVDVDERKIDFDLVE